MDPLIEKTIIGEFKGNQFIDDGYFSSCDDKVQFEEKKNIFSKTESKVTYVNKNSYSELQKLKSFFSQVDKKDFDNYRKKINSLEKINKNYFIDRASLKLANLDAIFNFTETEYEFGIHRNYQDNNKTFIDIAGGPGGFAQFLMYRDTNITGYGITLYPMTKTERYKLGWDNRLDNIRFKPHYNNIISEVNNILKDTNKYPQSLDIAVADGGIDASPEFQEQQSTLLIMAEILIGASKLKESKGTFLVVKLFDTITKPMVDLLYLTSHLFETIKLVKPLMSRPANSEKYLVCIDRKSDGNNILDFMKSTINSYNGSNIISFVKELPKSYVNWITKLNNVYTENQTYNVKNIITYFSGQEPEINQYNLIKFNGLLKVPS